MELVGNHLQVVGANWKFGTFTASGSRENKEGNNWHSPEGPKGLWQMNTQLVQRINREVGGRGMI